jgi:RepB DNA-primase N-terminal domain
LPRQSLLSDKTIEISQKKTLRVVTLTKAGHRLLKKNSQLPNDQPIYHGLVKPREVKHDAYLYRLYQKEVARIERAGGRPVRVLLDYELKRNLNRDLALLGQEKDDPDRKCQVAEKHQFHVVNGKIPIPDLRVEYETSDLELRHVDLELATRDYRPRAMAEKDQVVWKVSGFSQDEAESLLHNLANQFGGDLAATDSTRVLRLPGFANRKLSEEFIVQACQESDAVYMPRDFTIQEDSPETPRDIGHTQEGKRTVAREHKSQSERDWAFAKRALARGDDPEVVIQRIADYRAEDKTDPQYYARRTVRKAHDDLRHKGARVYASGQDPSPSDERSNGVSNPIPQQGALGCVTKTNEVFRSVNSKPR